MVLMIEGHDFHYEMENLCRIFFPYQKIVTLRGTRQQAPSDDIIAYTGIFESDGIVTLKVSLQVGQQEESASQQTTSAVWQMEKECERLLAVLLFGLLVKFCGGYFPKWGILTGVRPVKLLRKLIADMGEERAVTYFQQGLLVSGPKTEKCLFTMKNEQQILSLSQKESFSLYISIPFCPTRCAYCSFVSQSVVRAARLIPQYVALLCEEIRYTAQVAKQIGLRLESVYIGGGTPTTLSPEQLGQVMDAVNENFSMQTCREFTVEAGRPDTIDRAKLKVLKEKGATRISINPQTLNNAVLQEIGRRHTAEQAIDSFYLARELDFDNINMDLIVGLPKDDEESFTRTLQQVLELSPESVTVHALSLKRSSKIRQEGGRFENDAQTAGNMLDYADKSLFEAGYLPYYLYRQSRMVGNLENTGWAKPGFESPYNVWIMDETQTILACGAGAVSKVKDPNSENLKRIFNFKFPYEYVSRYSEMLERKEQVKDFYEQFCK